MKDIYFYVSINSWLAETPDATVRGSVNTRHEKYIEILDENGFTQIINLDKLFAVVY